jgi:hypothetical protein
MGQHAADFLSTAKNRDYAPSPTAFLPRNPTHVAIFAFDLDVDGV